MTREEIEKAAKTKPNYTWSNPILTEEISIHTGKDSPQTKTDMKRCKRCGRELDESEFYKHKNTKDGLQPYCKECQRELNRMRIKPKLPQLKVPQIGGG